ncbi:response regulator [Gimesia chilikensis]|jgi:CheY-like chemotaxis protein|uniref:Hybrid sensory kinase in two-component regulatory system with RcsB and YojN n=1 Tax=Gimesia chilikensis TaxID=2605989 RepID=A0A517PXY3_9PLAN|nr:response regulator [Gimesia chilikensis]QDT24245.1 hybrid sensory kinase in two-component regulatory system with RcsB and YojN [Gimesia chilikensis]
MKVLVVDDIGYSCHYYARLVEKIGFTAVMASSGFEAIKLLQSDNEIHVVLTDLVMSGMDGVDLFQKALQLERYSDHGVVPAPQFILMTAVRPENNAQDRNLQRIKLAKELGFSRIMFKPLDQDELKQELNDMSLNVIHSSNTEVTLDLYSPTQKIRQSVREIMATDNKEAASEFLEILLEEIANLKEYLKTS